MNQAQPIQTDKKPPRVLVIGGGYGGLKAVLGLQRKLTVPADITFISKHDYHYQTTLLHKVAIGTLSSRKARIFYRKILNPQNNKYYSTQDDIQDVIDSLFELFKHATTRMNKVMSQSFKRS